VWREREADEEVAAECAAWDTTFIPVQEGREVRTRRR
jgi:hypothetical protein